MADAQHRRRRLQDDSAERGRHRSDAQRRHEEPATIHHSSCASLARAALQVDAHLQAGGLLLMPKGTWIDSRVQNAECASWSNQLSCP